MRLTYSDSENFLDQNVTSNKHEDNSGKYSNAKLGKNITVKEWINMSTCGKWLSNMCV